MGILTVAFFLILCSLYHITAYGEGREASKRGELGHTSLDLTKAPASLPPYSYDFTILSTYWPPSVISKPSHARARHIVAAGMASSGFWCHGLWPARYSGPIPSYCTKESFDARQLGPFQASLAYFLRSPVTTSSPENLHGFWSHEWARHGTCSGLDQLSYFTTVYGAALHIDVRGVLASAHVEPSDNRHYTLDQITSALRGAYGFAFNPLIGLACAPPATRGAAPTLQEVRICLSRSGMELHDCSAVMDAAPAAAGAGAGEGVYNSLGDGPKGGSGDDATFVQTAPAAGSAAAAAAAGMVTTTSLDSIDLPWRLMYGTCGSEPGDLVMFPAYADTDAVVTLPWDVILRLFAGVVLLAVAAAAGYTLMQRWRLIPALFMPRPIVEVHYPPVSEPVTVCVEPLALAALWDSSPHIAGFVEDLPAGMGIKGGIARKLLKEKYGKPEPAGSFDIDVLLFVKQYSPEARRAAREAVAGCRLGGLVLEPQDVEVLSKDWLAEYFISRDVTQNEVLILKSAPGRSELYYTEQARKDVAADLIRPCVHALKTEFHLVWELEKDGTPYTASQQVVRSLVRHLKGHGNDYAFDRPTWAHYRRVGLSKLELFKVLRPFHEDDRKMQAAVDHLVGIGFLHRRELRRAGGVNMLWGLLLQEVNALVSRHGGRFVLGPLDSEGVERWVEGKKAATAARLMAEEMRSARTGFVQSEESVLDLGLMTFPQSLVDYIANGPTFDPSAFLRSAAAAAMRSLESATHQAPAGACLAIDDNGGGAGSDGAMEGGLRPAGGSKAPQALCGRSVSPELPIIPVGKLRWEAMQSAAAAGGGLVYQVIRRVGSGAALTSPRAGSRSPPRTGGYGGGGSSIEEELQREVERLRAALLPPVSSDLGSAESLAAPIQDGGGGGDGGGGRGVGGGGRGVGGGVVAEGTWEAITTAKAHHGVISNPVGGGGGGMNAEQRSLQELAKSARQRQRRHNAALKELISASFGHQHPHNGRADGGGSRGGDGGTGSHRASTSGMDSPLSDLAAQAEQPAAKRSTVLAAPQQANQENQAWLLPQLSAAATKGEVVESIKGSFAGDGCGGGGGGSASAFVVAGQDRPIAEESAETRSALKGSTLVAFFPANAELTDASGSPPPPSLPQQFLQQQQRQQRQRPPLPFQPKRSIIPRHSIPLSTTAAPSMTAAEAGGGVRGNGKDGGGFVTLLEHCPTDGGNRGGGGGGSDGSALDTVSYWLRYSSLAEAPDNATLDSLGSFYQVSTGPIGSGGRGYGDQGDYTPLVEDHELHRRRRPSLGKLVMFVVGVMADEKLLLLSAYGLMLCGLVARLCLPPVEAALFDAFNELDLALFWNNLMLAGGLILADTLLTLMGRLTMELFARSAMKQLFRRFFEHVVFQDLPFFARLSPGELMARTSGDSLTLRSIVSVTVYRLVEGATLFLGAAAFLVTTAGRLFRSKPQLAVAFLFLAAVDLTEAALLGMWLRKLNLAVRQSMGRMFGFTLSIFGHISLVSALGLERTAVADYRRFAADYFSSTCALNCLLHCHGAVTGLLSAALRFSLLALGGAALFDGVTTVGTLFALLQYCSWLQKGLKQASDGWARLMAGLGSVERLVELHDRGTFGAVPGNDDDGGGGSGGIHVGRSLFRDVDGTAAAAAAAASTPISVGRNGAPASQHGNGGGDIDRSLVEPLLGRTSLYEQQIDLEVNTGTREDSSTGATAGHSAHQYGGGGGGGGGGAAAAAAAISARRISLKGLGPRSTRPDFGQLLGGFKLSGVHLTSRSCTDRLLLRDANLEVVAGQALIVSGDDPEGLHGLLSLLMLRSPPYKGSLAFQLPRSALPSAAAVVRPSPLDRLLRCTPSAAATGADQPHLDAATLRGSAVLGGSGGRGGDDGWSENCDDAAATVAGATDWEWAAFSFRQDDLRAPRSRVALISRSMCGIFRTTLEDNVAVAAPLWHVDTADVRWACRTAGLHDEAISLKDGYFTMLGEGSGNMLSAAGVLRLAVARALLRRPALLLVEDLEAFSQALGEMRLMTLLKQLRDTGCCVVVLLGGGGGNGIGAAAAAAAPPPLLAWADVHMQLHAGTLGAARWGP